METALLLKRIYQIHFPPNEGANIRQVNHGANGDANIQQHENGNGGVLSFFLAL